MKTTSIELEVTLHCLDCFLTPPLELKAHLSKALIIYCPPGPIVFCRAATDTGLGSDPGGQVVALAPSSLLPFSTPGVFSE